MSNGKEVSDEQDPVIEKDDVSRRMAWSRNDLDLPKLLVPRKTAADTREVHSDNTLNDPFDARPGCSPMM